jgi:hypothetical protein
MLSLVPGLHINLGENWMPKTVTRTPRLPGFFDVLCRIAETGYSVFKPSRSIRRTERLINLGPME